MKKSLPLLLPTLWGVISWSLVSHSQAQELTAKAKEVFACNQLNPGSDERVNLPDWLLIHGENLKKNGCWSLHTNLGEQALAQAFNQGKERQELHLMLQLVSSYFYLGHYQRANELAIVSERLAEDGHYWYERVESLYLQSSVARVRQNKKALSLVEKALEFCSEHLPDNGRLQAKVLYNLGAALIESDRPNLGRARRVLKESGELFQQSGSSDYDIVRTGLRLARVEYLEGNYTQALREVHAVEANLTLPRARMLFYYQEAKILHRLERWEEAYKVASKALALAESLEARKDRERIQALVKAIQGKGFLAE